MRSWKPITIIVLLLIAVKAGSIGYASQKSKERYEQDVQRLYDIAGVLGHSQENHLNFYRSRAIGIDAHYDVIKLLFVTDASREEFTQRVRELGLQVRSTFSTEYTFLYNSWDNLKKDLVLRSKDVYNGNTRTQEDTVRRQPHITTWILFDETRRQTTAIEYAETDEKVNIWEYNGKQFAGSIVQVELDR